MLHHRKYIVCPLQILNDNARIRICCDNHMKRIRTPCGKNSEILSDNIGTICSNECALTGYNR
jgi:hypothetical protein